MNAACKFQVPALVNFQKILKVLFLLPGSLQQTHPYFSPIAYRSSLLGDRHQLKPGCDPITERENDVMIAKMQNDMNYYAETSGIDLGSLERMLSSEHTEEVGGVSLIGIAQQLNELKLTTGEVSIARLVLLLSTGNQKYRNHIMDYL